MSKNQAPALRQFKSLPGVKVQEHPVDWECPDDLDDLVGNRILAMGQVDHESIHYLNPRFTVSASSPTPAFFAVVLEAQSLWIHSLRRTLGRYGFRNDSRHANLANLGACHWKEAEAPSDDEGIDSKSEKSWYRALKISGIVVFQGNQLLPKQWMPWAQDLVSPDAAEVQVIRRRIDLAVLRESRDPGSLCQISLNEILKLKEANPHGTFFVCPAISVVSDSFSPHFLKEARDRQNEWHGRLFYVLGKDLKNELINDSPVTSRLLTYHGTLFVDGLIYLPACWPDKSVTKKKLAKTPHQSPTVPLEFFGL